MAPAQILRNQWFLLFSLLAIVSLGTTVFDIGSGRFAPRPNHGPISSQSKSWNNDLATERTPTSASPTPNLNIPVLKPKTSGKWIVDASGSAEADSRELSAVIANASDGDTIMLQPGEYKGEVTISKSVHVIGVTDQKGAGGALPVIHGSLTGTGQRQNSALFTVDPYPHQQRACRTDRSYPKGSLGLPRDGERGEGLPGRK